MKGKRQRVLLIITDSHIGGTEKIMSLLARNLDRRRYHPIVCSIKPPGEMAREVRQAGVDFFSLGFRPSSRPMNLVRIPKLVASLRREITVRKVDIVHSFLFLANIVARLAAAGSGRPIISSIRVEEKEKGYHHFIERLTKSLVDLYVVPTSSLADFTVEKAGLHREKVIVIPNAVEEWSEEKPGLRKRLGLEEGLFLIGFVGRLHRQKGVDILLEAFSRLPERSPARLVLIGEGPERGSLEKKAGRLGLSGQVFFTGWIPKASKHLKELDLLVLPSRWEGQPNAILEAMVAKVPLAAASVGGVREILEEGELGFLFPPEDAPSLASLINDMMEGRLDVAARVDRAARKVEQEYGIGKMIAGYQSLYDRFLES